MRKKHFLSIALILTILASTLVGCNSSTPTNNAGSSNEGQNLRAAMITTQKLGDEGPIDLSYEGLKKGSEDFGYDIQVVETQTGEYEESIKAIAEEGYDLVVCVFPDLLDALTRVAPDYPDTKFMMILGEVDSDNVKGTYNKEQEGSFLAGVLAAGTTNTNKIGFIAGADIAQNNRLAAGYQQGAQAVDPNIEVSIMYVGSFEDPTKGKELALMLYNQGHDVIYHAAAKSGLGIFEAAKELGEGHYVIGTDVDQNNLVPGQVLASMLTHYDLWIYETMQEVAEDTFEGQVVWYDLKSGKTELGLVDDSLYKIPDELKQDIEDFKTKIENKEITVKEVPTKK